LGPSNSGVEEEESSSFSALRQLRFNEIRKDILIKDEEVSDCEVIIPTYQDGLPDNDYLFSDGVEYIEIEEDEENQDDDGNLESNLDET
jgi:hypothetical protein